MRPFGEKRKSILQAFYFQGSQSPDKFLLWTFHRVHVHLVPTCARALVLRMRTFNLVLSVKEVLSRPQVGSCFRMS